MAIIGIVASIAIPRYASSVNHYRLKAAAERIIVDMSLTRRLALISSTSRTVTFDVPLDQYTLARLDNEGEPDTVRLAVEPYTAKVVSAEFGDDSQIIFDIYGAPDSGGTVVVQVGSYAKTITLDALTGKASTQ